ncbi:hypothetical protein J8C06_01680 [Chloracidobacterium validum]|uniref:Uncharacterized protein n=1 Tax=Chloracidobacterium validum TaxID=2821543 RepID=A0ABX8BDN2_9BACT|nr:hypothetical protein [Chloracidobacterium validum]QUW03180.1 hypothetical protein J8C06_01680 [Chloracidobacterium validum]
MARFTETDQAARLLQQIVTMPAALQPVSYPETPPPPTRTPWAETAEPVATDPLPPTTLEAHESAPVPPPSMSTSMSSGEAVVRELVVTRAGQVQLTLHVPPGQPAPFNGETVGQFFQRVVRPLPPSDQSTT